MSDDELNKLLAKVHKSITVFNYNNNNVPCIILTERRFSEIMNEIAGRPVSVDTNLNILQNGIGNVFVEITLSLSTGFLPVKGGVKQRIESMKATLNWLSRALVKLVARKKGQLFFV